MKNRVFATLMCLVLMMGVLPTTAKAVEIVDSGKCGENATYTLNSDGEMRIFGEGAIELAYQEGITTIIIEEGITEISARTFKYCDMLSSIIIPDTVTTIGSEAFSGCKKLTDIEIPASVTKIGNDVFEKCDALKSIRFAEGNQHYSYDDKKVLFNKDKTVLFNAPSDLDGSYTIPDGVIEIDTGAFQGCSNLTEVIIPNGVTNISENAFLFCEKLTKVTIPETVRDIGLRALSGCPNLTEIIIDDNNPNFSCENGVIFDKANSTIIEVSAGIKEYKVPESVTVIEELAFVNCFGLKEVRFKGNAPKFEGNEYNMIFYIDGLTIRYPKNEPSWNETIENCPTNDYVTVTWKPYTPISTFGWICIAVAGTIVVGGAGFGTYKLIKKRKTINTENSDN